MAGSSYGTIFKITTWGESHGKAIGVIIDGCPSGLSLCEHDIQCFLDRRKPGQSVYSTPRKESDEVRILSGVFEGKTTGAPLSLIVENTSQRSHDYSNIAAVYRPGHADYTFDEKYGFRDYRGGGRSSGRETIGRVAAGAVAVLLLKEMGIHFTTFTRSIGPVSISEDNFDPAAILKTPTYMPDFEASRQAELYLKECMKNADSAGGVIECRVTGVPAGLGDPVFEKLDANLAKALVSIGSVKAFEMGDGCQVAHMKGSENNDVFYVKDETVQKRTNHSGGTLGGISDGAPLIMRAYLKPTPSIFSAQETVTNSKDPVTIQIQGRHDPVIVPRAVVVVEAMAALTILDALLLNMSARLDSIVNFYKS